MQNTTSITTSLEKEQVKMRTAAKEELLREWREEIKADPFLSPEIKTIIGFQIDKLGLYAYLDNEAALKSDVEPKGTVEKRLGSESAPAKPQPNAETKTVTIDDLVHVSFFPTRQKHSLTLDTSKAHRKEKESPRNRHSPKSMESPKRKDSLKGSDALKSSDCSKDKDPPATKNIEAAEFSKSQDSPKRKISSSSPRMFITEEETTDFPKRRKQSLKSSLNGKKDSSVTPGFFDTLPISQEILVEYLKYAKPYLEKADGNIDVLPDLDRPNIELIVTPHRDMKTNTEHPQKTVILIDRNQLEGEGAYNQVIRGFDLINRQYLAVKLLSPIVTATSREKEIENLKKRKWFYGCYRLTQVDQYALVMKLIPGDTLLETLYVIDPKVSKDHIYANYCPEKKKLSFELQFKIIASLMKQLAKLHDKYKLLHRDLKPANIKVYFANGKIKVRIIDLGDAIPVDSKAVELCGTDGYLDDRVSSLIDPVPFDIYADIFSAAVIIAEILTKSNYQQKIREEKSKVTADIVTPRISGWQIQKMLEDVFKPEPDEADNFGSFEDHERNMQNFILLELKKLAKKMLTTRLNGSSLTEEIERLDTIDKDCQQFSEEVRRYWDSCKQLEISTQQLQSTVNAIHERYTAGLFFPQKKFQINSIKSATECFKSIHTETEESSMKLFT
ncbi:serine/threonine kinase US3 [Legionella massiliensis]|uniref:Serine/threonine kinase US3 n=1 Tax=Legionella massiliensis TaxID=1034943 RepID=A0A078KVM9_9GAMM|nr:hypothetical protein [Legionella massiliensis]CDZ75778.1 serine/threonine kinase US3 [Legionella massiliensis]CEE11516.1 Protein kinase domain protein [Legionella massiliensis]